MIRFRYQDLIQQAPLRPPGYLEAVFASSIRRGQDVLMTADAYRAIRDQFPIFLSPPPDPSDKSDPSDRSDMLDPSPPSHEAPPLPTWDTMIANAATESVKWAARGFPLAPKAALEFRRLQCLGDATTAPCEHWRPKLWLRTGGCELCGCSRAKLWLATTQCPAKPPRWHAIPQPKT